MIKKLIINEITPVTDGTMPIISGGRLYNGDELDGKIHDFFKRHIERSFSNPKMKNMRFSNFNSTLFNSSKSLLIPDENGIINEEIFIRENDIITKKFAENIHKNVTNPFLFIILTFAYQENNEQEGTNEPLSEEEAAIVNQGLGEVAADIDTSSTTENSAGNNGSSVDEILCLIKMERFDGVQYTAQTFNIHPDMLPDYKTDLQKCAFIFRSKIEGLAETDFTIADELQNLEDNTLDLHSKVLDRQDENISKYFMTSFLESYPIAKDGEVTKLVQKHAAAELSKYLGENCSKQQVNTYLENLLQKRERTSVSRVIEDVIHNSNLINMHLIEELNLDVEKISNSVFNNMRKENNTVYQEFTSLPEVIEKSSIKDIENDGRDIKIYISKMYQTYGYASIDAESSEEYVVINLLKDKINLNLN